MGLKDKVVRALALRWARGKVKDLRGKKKETGMGKVLKFLDGWKLLIAFVLLAAFKAWDMAHNGHASDALGIVLALLGWTPGAEWSVLARDVGVHALALAGAIHKVIKAVRQARAGSTAEGVLSVEGYVAEYVSGATKAAGL